MAENCSHSHTPPTMHSLNGDQTWERCLMIFLYATVAYFRLITVIENPEKTATMVFTTVNCVILRETLCQKDLKMIFVHQTLE